MSNYCMLCGSELILGGNDMISDVDESVESLGKDDAMITNATCPKCGANYIMTDATENEQDEDPHYVGSVQIYMDNEGEE